VSGAALWLALVLALGATVVAAAMLRARSLLVMAVCLAAIAALVSGAVILLGGGDGALAIVVVGVGLAPFLILAGLLLSARTAKTPPRGALWLSAFAIVAGLAGALSLGPELAVSPAPLGGGEIAGVWLAVLVFAAGAGCAGLLGYGERGVLERREPGRES
jgi:hypothetical protein